MSKPKFVLSSFATKLSVILMIVFVAFGVPAGPENDADSSLGAEIQTDGQSNSSEEDVRQFESDSEELAESEWNAPEDEDFLASLNELEEQFQAADAEELNLELSEEDFGLLHKGESSSQARENITSKLKMCAATEFTERKSILKHIKLKSKKLRKQSKKKDPLKAYMADIAALKKQIKAESIRRSEKHERRIQTTIAAFEKSCDLGFQKFLPEVKRQAQKNGVPVETLLSMMTLESRGNCFASVEEGGKDPLTGQPLHSRGLFQVHAKFTQYGACSDQQKEEIRKAKSLSQLKKGPECIENPVLNLRAAVKVLSNKAKALVKKSKPYEIYFLSEKESQPGQRCWQKKSITVSGFKKSKLVDKNGNWNSNLWRMAISAYNGGERWVFRAKRNIEVFNRLHGTKVDPYDWNSLKDYYYRRTLSHKQQLRYFGVQERDRDLDYAILNVIYAESMVSTPKSKSKKNMTKTLADLWKTDYLGKKPSKVRLSTVEPSGL